MKRACWILSLFVLLLAAALGGPKPGRAYDCDIRIYDWDGAEHDLAWLQEKWGDVRIDCRPDTWRVVLLVEDLSGNTATVVGLFGEDGYPLMGIPVTNLWADGSVTAETDDQGRVYFPWGPGAYYDPPNGGPYTILVHGFRVDGLGWLRWTNHHHLNLILWGNPPTLYDVYLPMIDRG